MLFSREDVAAELNGAWECAWVNVRPAPRVEIDFGDGRRLTRTLQGNVATYLCGPDGRVRDIIPGVCDPATYLRRLRGARAPAPGQIALADSKKMEVERPVLRAVTEADLGKKAVEVRVKDALHEDSRYNEDVRMPRVRALLAANPGAEPAALRGELYRDILGYDLADPWLGLAPEVLGGEAGRH